MQPCGSGLLLHQDSEGGKAGAKRGDKADARLQSLVPTPAEYLLEAKYGL